MTTSGTLYLIPNTLGEGDEEALRTVLPAPVRAIAQRLTYIVGENAKATRAFLKRVETLTPIQQIRIEELNVRTGAAADHTLLDALLAPLLAGQDGGLISDAGCPAVADPGAVLVRRAHEHGIRVVPLVGPSAILLALMASGLDGQRFAFHGYLPSDAAARAQRLRELEQQSRAQHQTQLFIETPYRNAAMLDALLGHCQPGTTVCFAADLTLPTEQVVTLPLKAWRALPAERRPDMGKRPAIFLMLAAG